MGVKELVVGSVVATLVASAFIVPSCRKPPIIPPFTGPNSPIKIVGGSIKVEAPNSWKSLPAGGCCVVSNDLPLDGTKVVFKPSLPSLKFSWKITIKTFNEAPNGSHPSVSVFPSDANGACNPDPDTSTQSPTNPNPPLCLTSSHTYVASQTVVSGAYFIPDLLPDSAGLYKRYRYRDTNCCNGPAPDFRESVASVTISYKTAAGSSIMMVPNSPCNFIGSAGTGECVVFIGK